jgi:hypothetical protein
MKAQGLVFPKNCFNWIAILPKAIYRLNTIPVKISMTFITETEKSILEFIQKHKKTPKSQSNTEQKAQWQQYRLQTEPHNKTISALAGKQTHKPTEDNRRPRCHAAKDIWLSAKVPKNTRWRKDSLFNKWYWENWTSTCRRLKLDPASHPVQNLF